MEPELVRTNHVLCPDCQTPTYGPYYNPTINDFFDGFYCEDCGLTWRWNDNDRKFVSSFG